MTVEFSGADAGVVASMTAKKINISNCDQRYSIRPVGSGGATAALTPPPLPPPHHRQQRSTFSLISDLKQSEVGVLFYFNLLIV